MKKYSTDLSENFQSQLKQFLRLKDLNLYCRGFQNFEDKKIGLIGSSPICLLAGNIFAAFGANVTFFEKSKSFGGAWSSIKFDNIKVPNTTHIIMPNLILFELLSIFGVNKKNWTVKPFSMEWETKAITSFPKKEPCIYEPDTPTYFIDSIDLIETLIRSIPKEKSEFLSDNVDLISETPNGIELKTQNGCQYRFDLLFLTAAAKIKAFRLGKEKHNPNYMYFKNRSLVFVANESTNLGNRFIHINGHSPIREIQTLESKASSTLINVKLSRYGSFDDIDVVKFILNQLFFPKTLHCKLKAYRKIEYDNFRMTPNSQKNIMSSSKLTMMPGFGRTKKRLPGNGELIRNSQDLSLCLGTKTFFDSINIPQLN